MWAAAKCAAAAWFLRRVVRAKLRLPWSNLCSTSLPFYLPFYLPSYLPSYLPFYLPFYLPTRGNPGDFEFETLESETERSP